MRLSVLIVGFLGSAFCCRWARADEDAHVAARRQLAETYSGCKVSAENPCGADLRRVQGVLSSPQALWAFITSPTTDYFERKVAVNRGAPVVPVEWLPKILAARRELAHESRLHLFAVDLRPPPRYTAFTPFRTLRTPRERIGSEVNRTILGHSFLVPAVWTDYPITDDEWRRAPWPLQVSVALNELYVAVARNGDQTRTEAVAMKLPCNDYETARDLVDLTAGVAQWRSYPSAKMVGTWLNILENPKTSAAAGIPLESLARMSKDNETWALTQAASLRELETVSTANNLHSMTTIVETLAPKPYTLLLSVLRHMAALDLTVWNRAEEVNRFLTLIGEPPLDPADSDIGRHGIANKEIPRAIQRWLKNNEPRLQRRADAERPLIESATRKLQLANACKQ